MRRLPAVLLAAAFLLTSCSGEESDPPDPSQELRDMAVADALREFDEGRLETGLEKVEAVLESYPDDAGAMRVKSMILASLERNREAISVLEKLVANEPDDLDVRHILGTVCFKEEMWEEATRHLEKSHAAQNRRDKARELLVTCYERLGRIDSAISLLEEMLKERPQDAILLTHRGNLLASNGKYNEAVSSFDKALEYDPSLPAAYQGLAISQAALEDYEETAKTLLAAIRRFPKTPGFRITLAETYLQLGRPLDALPVIGQLEEIAGRSRESALLRNTAEAMLRAEGKPIPPR